MMHARPCSHPTSDSKNLRLETWSTFTDGQQGGCALRIQNHFEQHANLEGSKVIWISRFACADGKMKVVEPKFECFVRKVAKRNF
jgi:hypothetical protein